MVQLIAGGKIQLGFLAVAEQAYVVQFREDLATGSWLTLTNIGAQSMTTNVTVVEPLGTHSQRFYRVVPF
jgi:hypothetical protein